MEDRAGRARGSPVSEPVTEGDDAFHGSSKRETAEKEEGKERK